jgi:hypothetical protein
MRAVFPGGEELGAETSLAAGLWRRRAVLIAVLALAVLGCWAWPDGSLPLRYPDSVAYVHWPTFVTFDGVERPSRRPPSYPLLLEVVGTGPALVQIQTWLSLGCWCLLGWAVAGVPGLFLGGLLALAPAVRLWNQAILTESISLSFLILIFALSLMLYRRWRWWLFSVWALGVVYFGFLRDANLLLLPFFALPLLHHGRRRFGVIAALLTVVLVVGMVSAQLEQRWKTPYYTALVKRIARNPAAFDHFRTEGMPAQLGLTPEMDAWLVEKGKGVYQRWVVSRPESYRVVWEELRKQGEGEFLRHRYFERLEDTPDPAPTRVADWLYRISSPPRWLWLGILCLPLLDWLRNRQAGALSIWAAGLVPAGYLLAFSTYHAAGTEVVRHMLLASILYRLTFFVALLAVVERLIPLGISRFGSPRRLRDPDLHE